MRYHHFICAPRATSGFLFFRNVAEAVTPRALIFSRHVIAILRLPHGDWPIASCHTASSGDP